MLKIQEYLDSMNIPREESGVIATEEGIQRFISINQLEGEFREAVDDHNVHHKALRPALQAHLYTLVRDFRHMYQYDERNEASEHSEALSFLPPVEVSKKVILWSTIGTPHETRKAIDYFNQFEAKILSKIVNTLAPYRVENSPKSQWGEDYFDNVMYGFGANTKASEEVIAKVSTLRSMLRTIGLIKYTIGNIHAGLAGNTGLFEDLPRDSTLNRDLKQILLCKGYSEIEVSEQMSVVDFSVEYITQTDFNNSKSNIYNKAIRNFGLSFMNYTNLERFFSEGGDSSERVMYTIRFNESRDNSILRGLCPGDIYYGSDGGGALTQLTSSGDMVAGIIRMLGKRERGFYHLFSACADTDSDIGIAQRKMLFKIGFTMNDCYNDNIRSHHLNCSVLDKPQNRYIEEDVLPYVTTKSTDYQGLQSAPSNTATAPQETSTKSLLHALYTGTCWDTLSIATNKRSGYLGIGKVSSNERQVVEHMIKIAECGRHIDYQSISAGFHDNSEGDARVLKNRLVNYAQRGKFWEEVLSSIHEPSPLLKGVGHSIGRPSPMDTEFPLFWLENIVNLAGVPAFSGLYADSEDKINGVINEGVVTHRLSEHFTRYKTEVFQNALYSESLPTLCAFVDSLEKHIKREYDSGFDLNMYVDSGETQPSDGNPLPDKIDEFVGSRTAQSILSLPEDTMLTKENVRKTLRMDNNGNLMLVGFRSDFSNTEIYSYDMDELGSYSLSAHYLGVIPAVPQELENQITLVEFVERITFNQDGLRDKLLNYPYVGVELEMSMIPGLEDDDVDDDEDERRSDYIPELVQGLHGLVGALCRDGSVEEGGELKTAPMQYESALEVLSDFVSRAEALGCEMDSEAGLHVHISKASFPDPENYDYLLAFMNTKSNSKFVDDVSGRGETHYCQRAGDIKLKDRPRRVGRDKYRAVHEKDSTYEFRVFRPSLDIDVLKQRLEFVSVIRKFVISNQDRPWMLTSAMFIDWLLFRADSRIREQHPTIVRWCETYILTLAGSHNIKAAVADDNGNMRRGLMKVADANTDDSIFFYLSPAREAIIKANLDKLGMSNSPSVNVKSKSVTPEAKEILSEIYSMDGLDLRKKLTRKVSSVLLPDGYDAISVMSSENLDGHSRAAKKACSLVASGCYRQFMGHPVVSDERQRTFIEHYDSDLSNSRDYMTERTYRRADEFVGELCPYDDGAGDIREMQDIIKKVEDDANYRASQISKHGNFEIDINDKPIRSLLSSQERKRQKIYNLMGGGVDAGDRYVVSLLASSAKEILDTLELKFSVFTSLESCKTERKTSLLGSGNGVSLRGIQNSLDSMNERYSHSYYAFSEIIKTILEFWDEVKESRQLSEGESERYESLHRMKTMLSDCFDSNGTKLGSLIDSGFFTEEVRKLEKSLSGLEEGRKKIFGIGRKYPTPEKSSGSSLIRVNIKRLRQDKSEVTLRRMSDVYQFLHA